MLRRHITCQFDRRRASSAINAEDTRPRGLMSGSARWLTSRAAGYVAASGLRLSGEQWRTRYGPDTCRLRTLAWPWSRPGYSLSRNPGTFLWVARTLHRGSKHARGGSGPCPEVRSVRPVVRYFPMGVQTLCWYPGIYRLIRPRGGPGAVHVVGSSAVHHATRDSRTCTVSSYCSKGYPWFRVPTVAPGPASGEETSLQVGLKLDWWLARCFCVLADVITASPPTVTPTVTPVPVAVWPVASALDGLAGPRRVPRYRCIGFENSPSLSSVAAPMRRGTGTSGGSTSLHPETDTQGGLKGKCAFGPFLSILVIECKHKCLNVKICPWMNKVQITK
jgi:hypothetical protein